jgi:hypothetical protein
MPYRIVVESFLNKFYNKLETNAYPIFCFIDDVHRIRPIAARYDCTT